ncbi:HP0495 family protein [Helicobacter equorum]|uniref:HP0495 family protein n=1 Tax=Helicobacter equorum TaxID=361872 RepID=UPI000CF199AE|nr:DUF493 domain-containing protein [Helicobacter equorum]
MQHIHNDLEQTPQIVYPTLWEYVVIGRDETQVQNTIFETINTPYKITKTRFSHGGKFVSVHIKLEVDSQEQRDRIFNTLSKHQHITMVI